MSVGNVILDLLHTPCTMNIIINGNAFVHQSGIIGTSSTVFLCMASVLYGIDPVSYKLLEINIPNVLTIVETIILFDALLE